MTAFGLSGASKSATVVPGTLSISEVELNLQGVYGELHPGGSGASPIATECSKARPSRRPLSMSSPSYVMFCCKATCFL